MFGTLSLRLSGVRELYFQEINESGAKAIGIDVIFEQADFDSGGDLSDQRFADVIAQHKNVVLAGKLIVPPGRADIITLVPPYEKFVETGVSWGLVSFDLDEDGFYRRYLVGQTYSDQVYGSITIAGTQEPPEPPEIVTASEDDYGRLEDILPQNEIIQVLPESAKIKLSFFNFNSGWFDKCTS